MAYTSREDGEDKTIIETSKEDVGRQGVHKISLQVTAKEDRKIKAMEDKLNRLTNVGYILIQITCNHVSLTLKFVQKAFNGQIEKFYYAEFSLSNDWEDIPQGISYTDRSD